MDAQLNTSQHCILATKVADDILCNVASSLKEVIVLFETTLEQHL